MKIKPEDFSVLQEKISHLDTEELRQKYQAESLSAKRYRWDLLYASKVKIGDGIGTQGDVNVYGYADDSHIDTALRTIVCDDAWRPSVAEKASVQDTEPKRRFLRP